MSFHDDFSLQLRADLAQATGLPSAAVYLGREAQKVTRQGLEVWIKPSPAEAVSPNLLLHTYDLHLRWKEKREGDQTGAHQFEPVREALEGLRRRFDGTRPFARAIPTLVAIEAEEAEVDALPDDQDVLTAVLRLRVLVSP